MNTTRIALLLLVTLLVGGVVGFYAGIKKAAAKYHVVAGSPVAEEEFSRLYTTYDVLNMLRTGEIEGAKGRLEMDLDYGTIAVCQAMTNATPTRAFNYRDLLVRIKWYRQKYPSPGLGLSGSASIARDALAEATKGIQ